MTARPSWMARKRSTRPPERIVPSPPTTPASALGTATTSPPEALAFEAAKVDLGPMPTQSGGFMAAEALAQAAEENATLRAQVAEMAKTMARLRRQVLEASEGELVSLALAIAERVVARELATSPSLVVLWARQAIDALAAKGEVVIAIAKDVSASVPAEAWVSVGVACDLEVDAQLPPGSIEVRTPQGIVAASEGARLAAVAAALGMGES